MVPVIAGNWKMHHGPSGARAFFDAFRPGFTGEAPTLLVFPTALAFQAAREALPATPEIHLGVQNIHWEESGAFTGEISAPQAADAGASHVLVGHSERRHVFGESDDVVALKVGAALTAGLVPVICVGERLEERREGRVDEVILRQLDAALAPVLERDSGDRGPFMLAYEPVWAIGTGETATPEDASAAHGTLGERLHELLGEAAGQVPVLYGGSVKPHNAGELLDAPGVGGLLVGGASLDPESFAAIATAA